MRWDIVKWFAKRNAMETRQWQKGESCQEENNGDNSIAEEKEMHAPLMNKRARVRVWVWFTKCIVELPVSIMQVAGFNYGRQQ